MTNYPRDEFDRVPENSARRGVHRDSLAAEQHSLVPLMIFGVAALCIGLLAFLIVPKLSSSNSATPQSAVVHTATAAPATPTAAPATAAPTKAAPTTAAAPSPTPKPTPEATVDKSIPVAIFNATGISGLAAQVTATVTANGWTVSQASNWTGAPQGTSSIVYSGVAQKANAAALGALLNIPTLLDSTEMGIPLAVVLGPGAQ